MKCLFFHLNVLHSGKDIYVVPKCFWVKYYYLVVSTIASKSDNSILINFIWSLHNMLIYLTNFSGVPVFQCLDDAEWQKAVALKLFHMSHSKKIYLIIIHCITFIEYISCAMHSSCLCIGYSEVIAVVKNSSPHVVDNIVCLSTWTSPNYTSVWTMWSCIFYSINHILFYSLLFGYKK